MKIVDRADVRVIELRAELSLAFEAFEVGRFLGKLGREDLDDDGPVELGVESLVNRPLAARADLFEDLVLVNLRTNHKDCRVQNAECRIKTLIAAFRKQLIMQNSLMQKLQFCIVHSTF